MERNAKKDAKPHISIWEWIRTLEGDVPIHIVRKGRHVRLNLDVHGGLCAFYGRFPKVWWFCFPFLGYFVAHEGKEICQKKAPRVNLWAYMRCAACGQKLIHATRLPNGNNYFKGPDCGTMIRVTKKDLHESIVSRINDARAAEGTYKPSPEVIRLETQINRALDSGTEDTDQVISLILSGIAERYKCCVSDSETAPYADLSDIDPRQFSGIVSAVTLTTEGNISVKFK